MPGSSAYAAGRAHILYGVLADFWNVSVGGIGEECGGGRSAVASPSVYVSPMPLLHVELGEPSYYCVAKSLVVVLGHLLWRQQASHSEP